MNKKILLWIAVSVIILVIVITGLIFVGKGSQTNTEKGENISENTGTNIKEENNSDSTNDLEYTKDYKYWGIKDVTAPSIPELTWKSKNVINSSSVNIATTPFDYEIEEIYKKLKKNSYMQEYYYDFIKNCNEIGQGEEYNDAGYQIAYEINQYIKANLKTTEQKSLKNTSDFYVQIKQETSNYANPSSVRVVFDNLDSNNINQKEIEKIAEIIFGEYTEYLIYGKDNDRKKYNNTSKFIGDVQLSEAIKAGDSYYYMYREIGKGWNSNTVKIELGIGVYVNPNENFQFKYYGLDNTSIYNSMIHKFEDVLPETFGDCNPLEFSSFGNKYFKSQYPNYIRTYLERWDLNSYITEDNKVASKLNISMYGGCSDLARYQVPELDLDFYIEEKNGEISELSVGINGECKTFSDGDKEGQEFVNAVSTMIKCIFPELDLSGITYEEMSKSASKDVSSTILGKKVDGKLSISVKNESFTIKISL